MRHRLLIGLLASAFAAGRPAPRAAEPESIPWDIKALEKAPGFTWVDQSDKVHSLLYEAEPYRGKPTKVFAYFASPVTLGIEKTNGKRFPGIVLVHGGGGHAFREWAELYARRGYAAIAMDLDGHAVEGGESKRSPDGGPSQDDDTKFQRSDLPDKDQWTYHAVADVILAHSLLRTFADVDPDRTGVIGISWGGYLTCIVAGLDHRFKAALPMYGCGYLHKNSFWVAPQFNKMTPEWRAKWTKLWDPSSFVASATMPMFFVNGTNDFAYPLDSYAKTYALVRGSKNIRIEVGMKHGHWFDQKECLMFFDTQFKGEPPLPRITRTELNGDKIIAEVQSPTRLTYAELCYTKGPHENNGERIWTRKPMTIARNRVEGDRPPAEATVYFVNVTDERGAMVSSALVCRPLLADGQTLK
jgi:dienelactone hydrolase